MEVGNKKFDNNIDTKIDNNTLNNDIFLNLLNFYKKLHNISDLNLIEFNNKKYLFFTVDRYTLNQNDINYFKEIYIYFDNNIKQITFNSIDKNLKLMENKLFFVRDLKYLKENDLTWGIFYFDLELPFEPILLINNKQIEKNLDTNQFNQFNINLIDYKFINNKLFLILRKSLTKSKFKLNEDNLNQYRLIEDIFYRHDSYSYLDSYDILFIKDFNKDSVFVKEFSFIVNSFEVIYNKSTNKEDILFIANLDFKNLPFDLFNELYFYDYEQDKINKVETFEGSKFDLQKFYSNDNKLSFLGYEIKDKDNLKMFKQIVNNSSSFLEFFKNNKNELITKEIFEPKYYSLYLFEVVFNNDSYKIKKLDKITKEDILIGNYLLRDIPLFSLKNYKWVSKNNVAFVETKFANVFINLVDVSNKTLVSFENYFKGDILDYYIKENIIYLIGVNYFNKDQLISYVPEIFEINIDLNSIRKITNFNEELLKEMEGVNIDNILNYTDNRADVWMIYNKNFYNKNFKEIKGNIFYIHGGPHAAYGNSTILEFFILANSGYRVFFSNPKGSIGYGLDFSNCIVGKWMDEDLKHIKNIIDSIREKFNLKDLVVAGGSYGGYMSAALISKFNIFRGAICERGVYNLLSFISTTDFPLFWLPYFKVNTIFDLLDFSPIKYYQNIDTNVLIIHSEGDFRCPISQAEEFYTLLKINNKNNKIIKFLRFPRDTNHDMSRTSNIYYKSIRMLNILDFLNKI